MEARVEVRGLSPNAWLIWLALGVASLGIGIWLVLSPRAAVATLAVLLAIALFVNGIAELLVAADLRRPWIGYAIGAIYVVAALVVVVRPGESLWFLAVFVGISIIITGLLQLAVALMDRDVVRHAGFLAFLGLLSVVVGIMAIVWPAITVFVLALLIGIRLILWGVVQLAVAFRIRRLTNG
jgi:uncharacterized membrane protein HdeD (DUF308 family)